MHFLYYLSGEHMKSHQTLGFRGKSFKIKHFFSIQFSFFPLCFNPSWYQQNQSRGPMLRKSVNQSNNFNLFCLSNPSFLYSAVHYCTVHHCIARWLVHLSHPLAPVQDCPGCHISESFILDLKLLKFCFSDSFGSIFNCLSKTFYLF